MKKIKMTVSQGTSRVELGFDTNKTSFTKIVGTCVSDFFRWHKTMKAVGAKGFSGVKEFDFTIERDGMVLLDTGTVNRTLWAKMKLINSAVGRARFAQRLKIILDYAFSEVQEVSLEELVERTISEAQPGRAAQASA
jgi:hypothetical protein